MRKYIFEPWQIYQQIYTWNNIGLNIVCHNHQCLTCCSLQLRQARHGELAGESLDLCFDFCYSLLELLSLSQSLNELLQWSLWIQARLHLQGQHDTCRRERRARRAFRTASETKLVIFAFFIFNYLWITSVNELSHLLEVFLHQTSGGQSWRAKPQTARTQSTFIPYNTNT